jgi:hypothetical protein
MVRRFLPLLFLLNPGLLSSADRVQVGRTVDVVRGRQANGREGFWPCGSSLEAFDEMQKLRADDHAVKIVMRKTHSIGLTSGLRVKVLDIGIGEAKIRVLGAIDQGHLYTEDPRTGTECWVVPEALGK